jgi:hypothetical protein
LDSLFDETGPAAGFFIDDIPMGELQWQESTYPIDHLLVVSAVQGFHRFDIRQVSGSYHFLSVTIWMSAPEGVDEP